MLDHLFASAIIDFSARWERQGLLIDVRRDAGWARTDATVTTAASGLSCSALTSEERAWLSACAVDDDAVVREATSAQGEVRAVARRRIVITSDGRRDRHSSTIVRRERNGVSTVVALDDKPPEHLAESASNGFDAALPLHFTNGSAAVLLHEAIGHPAEGGNFIAWPEWLKVVDDPHVDGLGAAQVDDVGNETKASELTRNEPPSALRRFDFRDAPLPRMTNLIVTAARRVSLPASRIDVTHIEHGRFLPHRDEIELRIVRSSLLQGSRTSPLAPWTLTMARAELSTRIAGTTSETLSRYSGVICSVAGQSLPVGSFSVDLLVQA